MFLHRGGKVGTSEGDRVHAELSRAGDPKSVLRSRKPVVCFSLATTKLVCRTMDKRRKSYYSRGLCSPHFIFRMDRLLYLHFVLYEFAHALEGYSA